MRFYGTDPLFRIWSGLCRVPRIANLFKHPEKETCPIRPKTVGRIGLYNTVVHAGSLS
jgi:hypothetical protein